MKLEFWEVGVSHFVKLRFSKLKKCELIPKSSVWLLQGCELWRHKTTPELYLTWKHLSRVSLGFGQSFLTRYPSTNRSGKSSSKLSPGPLGRALRTTQLQSLATAQIFGFDRSKKVQCFGTWLGTREKYCSVNRNDYSVSNPGFSFGTRKWAGNPSFT